MTRKQWGVLVVLGVLGVGAYNTLAYVALVHTTATNAALLNSFIPIAIIAISWFLGHQARLLESIGVGVSFVGVMVIVSRGDPVVLAGLSLNAGDLWMLAAVLSWALYTLGLKWRPAGLHPMALLATLTMIGLLVLAPLVWVELSSGARLHLTTGPVWRRLYRDLSGLPRLRVLQPGSGRSRCFPGRPVHSPDAGLQHDTGHALPGEAPRAYHFSELR
jgi:drug/metabolite transporter (DMT)-like permease